MMMMSGIWLMFARSIRFNLIQTLVSRDFSVAVRQRRIPKTLLRRAFISSVSQFCTNDDEVNGLVKDAGCVQENI